MEGLASGWSLAWTSGRVLGRAADRLPGRAADRLPGRAAREGDPRGGGLRWWPCVSVPEPSRR
jgi:hypothetical protein